VPTPETLSRVDVIRELPNTDHAARFDGEPMVQCFRVGDLGYVWITTAEAMTVPGFGHAWVAGKLAAYEPDELRELLPSGLRLRAVALVAA
jgi:hypothetical protein